LKKTLAALASLAVMVGTVGAAQAGTHAPTRHAARSTKAPPAVKASTRAADLAKFRSGKRLSARQLRALGLKPLSHRQVARIKKLQKMSKHRATMSAVGAHYWFTWQNARNSWSDRYYSGPYYSYPWYPYYVVYDNWKTCTFSGTNCIDAHAYTYQYYLYYYPNGTWYYYNTGGYQSNSVNYSGFGPYAN
jgi:hypothetical protein